MHHMSSFEIFLVRMQRDLKFNSLNTNNSSFMLPHSYETPSISTNIIETGILQF